LINPTNLIKHIDLNKKIYIAYSGGADSTALLYLFSDLRHSYSIHLEAIHVDHNLSPDNNAWESHCKNICNKLDIILHTKSVHIEVDGDGLESAARKARYKVFSDILKEGEQLLLGHHANDVTETILIRMFRGTGIDGLEGPALTRPVGKGVLIRPLLDLTKIELLEYLKNNEISFIEDSSNFESNQDRNFIRNDIIPLIEERWKNISSRIQATSEIIRGRNKSYSYLLDKNFNHLIKNKIPVKDLKKVDSEILIDILRTSIREQNICLPSKKITKEIIKTFILSRPGPRSEVSWSRDDQDLPGGSAIYRDGCIVILKK
jgi:tRNA(Ile)-lysidine synthase